MDAEKKKKLQELAKKQAEQEGRTEEFQESQQQFKKPEENVPDDEDFEEEHSPIEKNTFREIDFGQKTYVSRPLSIWKLVSGILSIILFAWMEMQSCSVTFLGALAESEGVAGSGMLGMMAGILILAGGIVSIVVRNRPGFASDVSVMILFSISAFLSFIGGFSIYGDLVLYGAWSFICALLAGISLMLKRSHAKDSPVWPIIIFTICVLFMAVGIVGGIFYGTSESGTAKENEETEDVNEDVSAEEQDTEKNNQINVLDIEEATGDAEYEVTDQICEFGEPNTFDNRYYPNILIQIQNTGTDNLYLESAVYVFEDENGHEIYRTDSGYTSGRVPQIVKPGEYGYFYMSYSPIDVEEFDPATCTALKPELTVKTTNKDPIYYEISDLNFTKDSDGCSISGTITNNTDEDNDFVEIYCIGFDAEGNPLGIEPTFITDLNAGDTAEFSQIMMFIDCADEIDSWEVYSFPYQYEHDLT